MSKRYYPINRICRQQVRGGFRRYLVEWKTKNKRIRKRTWQPMQNLQKCMEEVVRCSKRANISLLCGECRQAVINQLKREQQSIDADNNQFPQRLRAKRDEEKGQHQESPSSTPPQSPQMRKIIKRSVSAHQSSSEKIEQPGLYQGQRLSGSPKKERSQSPPPKQQQIISPPKQEQKKSPSRPPQMKSLLKQEKTVVHQQLNKGSQQRGMQFDQLMAKLNLEIPVTLFVGNIPHQIPDKDVRTIFQTFGTLASCDLPYDKDRRRGYGFITYKQKQNAELAIASLNGKVIAGRELRVQIKAKK